MNATWAGWVVAGWVGIAAAGPELQRFEFREPHMGTTAHLVLYASDEATARAAGRAAFRRIAELNGIMSDYLAASELNELSRNSGHGPRPIGPDLFAVLRRAEEISRSTGGAFDVTVGPAAKLWRRARRTQRFPDADHLADARAKVGFDKLRLNPADRTAELTVPGMQLDLGGIAKGYAADEVLKCLRQQGVTRAMIAVGGDVAAGDAPPGSPGWEVAIRSGVPGDDGPGLKVTLCRRAISTSAIWNNMWKSTKCGTVTS